MVAYFLVICFCSFFALRQDDPFKKYQGPIYRYPQIQNWSFGFADKFRVSAQKMLAYVFVIFFCSFPRPHQHDVFQKKGPRHKHPNKNNHKVQNWIFALAKQGSDFQQKNNAVFFDNCVCPFSKPRQQDSF